MKIALLIVVLMSSFNNLVGQISPQFDDMWVIQRDISDEFNEEKLDNDKWIKPLTIGEETVTIIISGWRM
ncbi:MAG: hypothetical protein ACI35Y_05870 [Candidatus Limimorpha sp.]